MKKILLFTTILAIAFNTFSQTNTFPTTGNVGIGTTTPAFLLDIKANTDNQELLRLSHPTSPTAAGFSLGFGSNFGTDNGAILGKIELSGITYNSFAINRTNRDFVFLEGNVGIGTTSPAAKLHILESNLLGSTSGNNVLLSRVSGISSNVVMNNHWLIRDADGSSWYTARWHDGISVDASYLTPGTDTKTWWERDPYNNIQSWGNANNTYMSIVNGKVGIGTTSPSVMLDIVGSYGRLLISDLITDSTIKYNRIGTRHYINSEEPFFGVMMAANSTSNDLRLGGGTSIGNAASQITFYLASNSTTVTGTEFARMTPTGFGIGINPTTPIDIVKNLGNGIQEYSLARLGYPGTGVGVRIGYWGNGTEASAGFIRSVGGNFYLGTSSYAQNIAILNSNGNVGIGTTTPQNKLDVSGTIRCTEVKVEALPWADFVFKPTYKLRSLSEVEQFIKTNNHLPDVPSEKEVKENGVSLGEMNAKLLQKIEELTLYMIEQQKQMEEQQTQINELKEQNTKLAKEIKNLNI